MGDPAIIITTLTFLLVLNFVCHGRAELICISESWRANSVKCRAVSAEPNVIDSIQVYGSKTVTKFNALYMKECLLNVMKSSPFKDFASVNILDLSQNRIDALESNVFVGLKELRSLNLSGNSIERIDPNAFSQLTKLVDLDLSHNILEIKSEQSIFKGLTQLRSLDISNNFEVSVIPDLFGGLNLRSLVLSSTLLVFPDTYLLDMPNLIFLDLSRNTNLFETDDIATVLEMSSNLVHLKISDVNLLVVDTSSFRQTTKLRILNISSNALQMLPADVFSSNVVLMDLDISQNQIVNLHQNLFRRNVELIRLNLSGNKIQNLRVGTFDQLSKLKVLNLQGNRIATIQNGLFIKNIQLSSLYLSNNQITAVNSFTFSTNKKLILLDISGNKLKEFSSDIVSNMDILLFLYLDDNMLTAVSANLINKASLFELHLSCNNLVSLPEDAFVSTTESTKLITLILRGNPWSCGCLNRFLRYEKTRYRLQGFADGRSLSCFVGSNPSTCDRTISEDDLQLWLEFHRSYPKACPSKLK